MPNLEERYLPEDAPLTDAWIFGVIDAIDFMTEGHKAYGYKPEWFEFTLSQLVEDLTTYAEKNWKDEFDNVKAGGAVPLSEGGSGANSFETSDPFGRSAWTGEDARSTELLGGDGPFQFDGLARSINSHPSSQRKNRLDQDNREVLATEIPTNGCGGSGHWFINKEGHLIGVCSCLAKYGTGDSGSKPRLGRHGKEPASGSVLS